MREHILISQKVQKQVDKLLANIYSRFIKGELLSPTLFVSFVRSHIVLR